MPWSRRWPRVTVSQASPPVAALSRAFQESEQQRCAGHRGAVLLAHDPRPVEAGAGERFAETAEALGLSVGATKVALHRARERLRATLEAAHNRLHQRLHQAGFEWRTLAADYDYKAQRKKA